MASAFVNLSGTSATEPHIGLSKRPAHRCLRPPRQLPKLPQRPTGDILTGHKIDQPVTLLRRLPNDVGPNELRQHVMHLAARVDHGLTLPPGDKYVGSQRMLPPIPWLPPALLGP